MNHPSICKCIDYKKDSEEDDDKHGINKNFTPGSTVSIFLKFHPMNLRECLERNILNNTLKAKLAVEIGFGMLHIHDSGMIHRDLKLENVTVNYIFEAQLIDFGLPHVEELKNTMSSMTKGIGTPAYMSPEMSNDEEYDNKTDVYSFGVLLFVLFIESFAFFMIATFSFFFFYKISLISLFKIECLINQFFGDKSTIEKEISQQLDYYLDNFADKMYQIPINSLYNIFNNENRN